MFYERHLPALRPQTQRRDCSDWPAANNYCVKINHYPISCAWFSQCLSAALVRPP
jgi:hypothetical protein